MLGKGGSGGNWDQGKEKSSREDVYGEGASVRGLSPEDEA